MARARPAPALPCTARRLPAYSRVTYDLGPGSTLTAPLGDFATVFMYVAGVKVLQVKPWKRAQAPAGTGAGGGGQ